MQVWQWLRHKAFLKDNGIHVNKDLIVEIVSQVVNKIKSTAAEHSNLVSNLPFDTTKLAKSAEVFQDIVFAQQQVEFITTYLYDLQLYKLN